VPAYRAYNGGRSGRQTLHRPNGHRSRRGERADRQEASSVTSSRPIERSHEAASGCSAGRGISIVLQDRLTSGRPSRIRRPKRKMGAPVWEARPFLTGRGAGRATGHAYNGRASQVFRQGRVEGCHQSQRIRGWLASSAMPNFMDGFRR